MKQCICHNDMFASSIFIKGEKYKCSKSTCYTEITGTFRGTSMESVLIYSESFDVHFKHLDDHRVTQIKTIIEI